MTPELARSAGPVVAKRYVRDGETAFDLICLVGVRAKPVVDDIDQT